MYVPYVGIQKTHMEVSVDWLLKSFRAIEVSNSYSQAVTSIVDASLTRKSGIPGCCFGTPGTGSAAADVVVSGVVFCASESARSGTLTIGSLVIVDLIRNAAFGA
jgi:hypothetical protein